MSLFFKNIGFELRFLWFCVAKPIILKSKTYAFGLQNDRFCVFLKSLVSFCFVKLIFLSLFYLHY